ncbi:TatD DNase [Gryganskiella cystojenkinii]|nr:TatD DNase [Gryganskiella cystojenkinii]
MRPLTLLIQRTSRTRLTMAPRLIDIGINLTDPMFRGNYHGKQAHPDDLDQVLVRAKRAGVERMIVTAGNLNDCKAALDLVKGHDDLFMTVGCHPTRCSEFEKHEGGPEGYFSALKEMFENPSAKGKIVAVGECGLDYDRLHFCPKETQLKYFERQFDLAETTQLPMFLHDRNTGSDFGALISKNRSRFTNGVVHSFTGTLEELQHYLDMGLYIGINGCSLKTEDNLKAAASVPLDRLMLETDGPWCDIRPTHASHKHLAHMTPDQQAIYSPTSKKKEKFEIGCMVKSRNEPCTMGQVLLVEAMKLTQRMKMNDGTVAPPSIPPGSAKIQSDSKKRKSTATTAVKNAAEYNYGNNPDLAEGEDEEEQDENIDITSTEKKPRKKGTPRRKTTSAVTGDSPPAKKLKAPPPVPAIVPPSSGGLLNYFNKTRVSSAKPTSQPETPATPTPMMTATKTSTTEDMDCIPSEHPMVPEEVEGPGESIICSDSVTSIDVVTGKRRSKSGDGKKARSATSSHKSTNNNSLRGVALSKTFRVKIDDEESLDSSTNSSIAPKPSTSRRSTSQTNSLDSVGPRVEKTLPPARSVLEFFSPKPVVKQDTSPICSTDTELPSEPVKEHDTIKRVTSESFSAEQDSAIDITSFDPTISSPPDNDHNNTIATDQDTEEPPPPRRRRLVRASDLNRPLREQDQSDDEYTAKKTIKEPVQSVDMEIASVSEAEKESSPEPESPEKIQQRQMMSSYFSMKPAPTAVAAAQPSLPVVVRTENQTPSPKTKRPPQPKRKKKKSSFSESEASGSDSESKNSDFEDSDGGSKEDEKPDPNQKAITSMFAKATVSSAPSVIREREKRPKMTARSRSLLSGGLSNYSNTCYLNSVLQMIRNARGCTDVLFDIQDKMKTVETGAETQIMITEYQRSLFDHMLHVLRALDKKEEGDEDEPSDKSSYPKDVIRTLRQGDSLFNTSEQQDAAEFLFYTISLFDDVLKALLVLQKEHSDTAPEAIATGVTADWHPINDLFQVGTQTVTHCQQCSSVTTQSDRGIDLTVQIDNDNPTMVRDLKWGISETMKMEHMKDDNQRFCDKCSQKADAHVHHYLTSLPKLLILRLQRYNFKEGAVKLQNGVSCTEQMNFSKWMSRDYEGPDPRYELCAILIHRGPVITSGHYYVYIRKSVDIETETTDTSGDTVMKSRTYQWLKYNDSAVDPVSSEGMARIFSGKVNGQGSKEGTNLADGLSSVKDHGSTFDEFDIATPYVYIYRRVEGEQPVVP